MPEPTITLPRLPNESTKAYQARLCYCTLGANRSLEAVGQALGKSKALMERWSVCYGWVGHARAYDDTLAAIQIQQAREQYLSDIEAHRKRYGETGRALYAVARKKLAALNARDEPERLTAIASALTIAADLEAHALRLAELIAQLEGAH
jgi:hypothetical protein